MTQPKDIAADATLEAASAWCLRLADGNLSPREQAKFAAWLDNPENRMAFEDAVGVWQGMGEARLTADLISLRREALGSFERASRVRWRMGWPLAQIAAVAASLLVAIAAWFWTAETETYRTDIGERRVVMLSDGSRLSLDAATVVKVRYTREYRRLWLRQGRAKFDVTRDARRPFTVAAADKVVRATGTAFSVELLQRQVRVVLYEGRVVVLDGPADGRPAPANVQRPGARDVASPVAPPLVPGAELIAAVEGSSTKVASVDPVRSLAWETGQLVFEDEPLAIAVERVNRYSERKLEIGDAALRDVRIDGVFAAGDPEAFVEGVTGVFPVRARREAQGWTLLSARP